MRVSGLIFALLLASCPALVPAQVLLTQNLPASSELRGQWDSGGMMARGMMGTVTEITPEHFTIKTETGDLYTVHYSVNTRIMKAPPRPATGQRGNYLGLPIPIKPRNIKVGDAIGASGEIDPAAKSLGAFAIFLIDPETARRIRQMQANYGKTWLMGRVTAINETQVTIQGGSDNATHTFSTDENTTIRKRHHPIALADIQPGDMLHVQGALKRNTFIASSVAVMPTRADRPHSPASPQP